MPYRTFGGLATLLDMRNHSSGKDLLVRKAKLGWSAEGERDILPIPGEGFKYFDITVWRPTHLGAAQACNRKCKYMYNGYALVRDDKIVQKYVFG